MSSEVRLEGPLSGSVNLRAAAEGPDSVELLLPEETSALATQQFARTEGPGGTAKVLHAGTLEEDTTIEVGSNALTTVSLSVASDVTLTLEAGASAVVVGGLDPFPGQATPESADTPRQVRVDGPLRWISFDLDTFAHNVAYDDSVRAGGLEGVVYSLSSGQLPAGVSLDAQTGRVHGTPQQLEEFRFALAASAGEQQVTRSYRGQVVSPQAPVWQTQQLGEMGAGRSFSQKLEAAGAPTPRFQVIEGALPAGITLDPRSGMLSGTPSSAGEFEATIQASSSAGSTDKVFSVQVTFIPLSASGGTKSQFVGEDGLTYTLHTFSTPGTHEFTIEDLGSWAEIEYLAVGGGGGGGVCFGGGGGAGGVVSGKMILKDQATLQVAVGDGGVNQTGFSASGGAGGESRFAEHVAYGGGSGGGACGEPGGFGGSGGGSSWASLSPGSHTPGQGHPGAQAPSSQGGGGGGAGGPGAGRQGGSGITVDFPGTTVTLAAGGSGSGPTLLAGGAGGGGAGGSALGAGVADATPGTGSGGGGTVISGSTGTSGRGGSGVVYVRYPSSGTAPEWLTPMSASGGATEIVSVDGMSYRTHTFTATSASTFTVTDTGAAGGERVEYLVVAGGGGGGSDMGGGGGGGGVRTGAKTVLSPGSYPVVVGTGGAGRNQYNSSPPPGDSGAISSFDDVEALGGAGGRSGHWTGSYTGPQPPVGGSGGGGSPGGVGTLSGSAGTPGQGTSGGIGGYDGNYYAGGGGGAGGNPEADRILSVRPGIGGPGLLSDITGTPLRWGAGGGGAGYTGPGAGAGGAGGGGGGARSTGPLSPAPGGTGGLNPGGQGGTAGNSTGGAGGANTGSGGGGGAHSSGRGGDGGSGIVVLRYPLSTDFSGIEIGEQFSARLSAPAYPTPVYRVTQGSLPHGLELDSQTGVVSGTPSGPGQFDFTIAASNVVGTVEQSYTVTLRPVRAEGGTESLVFDGGATYRLHTFDGVSADTLNVIDPGTSGKVRYLVVAGGGGGGMDMGGGGGGGGVRRGELTVAQQEYPVTVGAGGAGAPTAGTGPGTQGRSSHQYTIPAVSGENSSLGSIVAIGGGKGGSSYFDYTPDNGWGANGGSGGGSSGYSNTGSVTARRGSGTPGQGHEGGRAFGQYYSGGGGGAGLPGGEGTASGAPRGGDGVPDDILGVEHFWGGGGGGSGYSTNGGSGGRGGGGGGAVGTTFGGDGISPGQPGGGGGTSQHANRPGGDAGANTGGGGGGGAHYTATNRGGNGGSGIMVVRYVLSTVYRPPSTAWEISSVALDQADNTYSLVVSEASGLSQLGTAGWQVSLDGQPFVRVNLAGLSDSTVTLPAALQQQLALATTLQLRTPDGPSSLHGFSNVFTKPAESAPLWFAETLPQGFLGVPYAHKLQLFGFPSPQLSVTDGQLPPGVSLNQTSGELSGEPSELGEFAFTIRASNPQGDAERSFAVSVRLFAPMTATGGTQVFDEDGYRYHRFTAAASLVVQDVGDEGTVDAFVVGGGGGGGSNAGGGGGGFARSWYSLDITPGSFPVTVGAGGTHGGANTSGSAGGFSQFRSSTYRANGGQGGVYSNVTASRLGGAGGSGGGGDAGRGGADGSNGISAGSPGGSGQGFSTRQFNQRLNTQGQWETIDASSAAAAYAGGGGSTAFGTGSQESEGGGGAGGGGTLTGILLHEGKPNTGGGGGSSHSGSGAGARGGSGVVLVRYRLAQWVAFQGAGVQEQTTSWDILSVTAISSQTGASRVLIEVNPIPSPLGGLSNWQLRTAQDWVVFPVAQVNTGTTWELVITDPDTVALLLDELQKQGRQFQLRDPVGRFSNAVTFSTQNLVTPVIATGGTVTDFSAGDTNYRVHNFNSNGTFNILDGGGSPVDFLILAGGGGGGSGANDNVCWQQNGGGGGQIVTSVAPAQSGGTLLAPVVATVASHPVAVGGGGGAGRTNRCTPGAQGGGSSFLGHVATGGAGGFRQGPGNGTFYGASTTTTITGGSLTLSGGGSRTNDTAGSGPANSGRGGDGSGWFYVAGNGGSGRVVARYEKLL